MGVIVALFLLSACKPETEPVPVKQPDVTKPDPITKPDSGTSIQQPDPNKDTEYPVGTVLKLKKLSYSANDYQEVTYQADGSIARYNSQYLYNPSDGYVQKFTSEFQYDPNKRLVRLNRAYNSYVKYFYEGDKVVKTEEYNGYNELIGSHTYQYAVDRLTASYDVTINASSGKRFESKTTFEYDAKGNLTNRSQFYRNLETGEYKLDFSILYSNYDDKKFVENLTEVNPYLPGVTFKVNNPGLKVLKNRDGYEMTGREQYSYTYNADGYPLTRRASGEGGTLNATYSYQK
ncbi:hypothetical protein GCM10023189_25160 [Nibrella saemangeumensis]|uniref:YD repeat-containing protein n=2 Tax=Nibrella saemangeumensis TaxID=1084526 RepID=A0ABP8MUC6_9BACT